MPGNPDFVGFILAKCWAFSANAGIECQLLPPSFLFPIINGCKIELSRLKVPQKGKINFKKEAGNGPYFKKA